MTAPQIMTAILSSAPQTNRWRELLAHIARHAPGPVTSNTIEPLMFPNRPAPQPSKALGGVHGSLHSWVMARWPYHPWDHDDGVHGIPAWYQMSTAVAAVVLGPPPPPTTPPQPTPPPQPPPSPPCQGPPGGAGDEG